MGAYTMEFEPAVSWNGEGLPPVGCECEREVPGGWSRCRINYVSSEVVVYQMLNTGKEYASISLAFKFRPIRTETERKREECSAMIESLFYTESSDGNYLRGVGVYDAIAAGKIPHITLK